MRGEEEGGGGVLAVNPAERRRQVLDWAESSGDLTRPDPPHLFGSRYGIKGSAGGSESPRRGFDCARECVLDRIVSFKGRDVSGVPRARAGANGFRGGKGREAASERPFSRFSKQLVIVRARAKKKTE